VARCRRAIARTSAPQVEADEDLAFGFRVRGTPYFFINGRRLSGAQPFETFVAAVERAKQEASTLMAERKIPPRQVYAELMKTARGPEPPETKSIPAPIAANPSRGPADAPIVIQMFADFECPFCERVLPTLVQLEKSFPNKIRIVWRNLPLEFHAHARIAAAAALEAFVQRGNSGFWEMHKLLFENQNTPDAFTPERFEQYAHKAGLDLTRFREALRDGRHDAAIERDIGVAQAAGIIGTPSFVINGYFLAGAEDLVVFRNVVRLALSSQQAPAKRGTHRAP